MCAKDLTIVCVRSMCDNGVCVCETVVCMCVCDNVVCVCVCKSCVCVRDKGVCVTMMCVCVCVYNAACVKMLGV